MSHDNEVQDAPDTAGMPPNALRMFARIGDGHWYAILPGMDVALRNLGAVVRSEDEEPEPVGETT